MTFEHLHNLSLDWHLQKKLGQTIRSMDRGIGACDSLMRYLFLNLIPATGEMLIVVIIFASYFDYFPLAVAVFAFVFVYALLTILLTLWRKKFRNRGMLCYSLFLMYTYDSLHAAIIISSTFICSSIYHVPLAHSRKTR